MKRKEDDERSMGRPMFPRLHVNDAEKGGPRAPPRNKMALYEQFTIPSQSYNNSSSLGPSASRNMEIDSKRRMQLPLYQLPKSPSSSHNELRVQGRQVVNLTNRPVQMETSKKALEEDDLIVPIFSQELGRCISTTEDARNKERCTPQSGNQSMLLINSGKKANHSEGELISRQHVIDQGRRNLRTSDTPRRCLDMSRRAKNGVQQGTQEKSILSCSEKSEVSLCQNYVNVETRFVEGASDQPMGSTEELIRLRMKQNSCVGYELRDAIGVGIGIQIDCSPEKENVDGGDDVSEISVVDSASALHISSDDVVGIMGVKHFLKARTVIANQQRMLAAQLFELHRLMKVQGLIAGSPSLLLEGSAFVGHIRLKDSNEKKFSSEIAKKTLVHTIKEKADTVELKDKVECTAENAVSKVPAIQPPVSSPPVNTDTKLNPWSFHQPASHQWLMPVMCPSEGLVYKPCPAPGSTGPFSGGYGPTPLMGNFMNPICGMPPGIHFTGQGYFPTYGMPIMNPSLSGSVADQMNQFSWSDPYVQTGQVAGVSTKSSCNGPIQKNGATRLCSKESELQRSTASSPREQEQVLRTAFLDKERDALHHLPASRLGSEISEEATVKEKPSKVIRVVPHAPGSTREFAARIFQSLREERQQDVSN